MALPRDVADVCRLLRHNARLAVERLEAEHAPVDPNQLAERIVYEHYHLLAVRAHRAELRDAIADLIRRLRASREDLP
jgi:hypothetical protein